MPQFAAWLSTPTRARGYPPFAGQHSLIIEVAPSLAIHRIADLALKAAPSLELGLLFTERQFGLLELHADDMAEVEAAGKIILEGIGAKPEDQLTPQTLFHDIIENLNDQHAIILNRTRDASILVPDVSLLIYEMQPALFACVAANEAERAAPDSTINDIQMMGASGRVTGKGARYLSNWKEAHRSFYYEKAEAPDDIVLNRDDTAVLIIDIQNTYLEVPKDDDEARRWAPFFERMNKTVIPNTAKLASYARAESVEVMFARIACLTEDGRDRSLSQKKPGFNYLLLPKDREDSHIVPELAAVGDEITVLKTTDSALTGTNLRLILRNLGISNVIVAGIFTDQCISSTVRSLADESFNVVVVEDCCAAATMELHTHELEIINMIYCHVVQLEDIAGFLKPH
jgi:nicotinamidase-related amidase